MVRCLVRSELRESRLCARATLPDLQGVLRLGATEQAAVGPDHQDTLLFTAPLVRLGPGDTIELEIADRQAFGTRAPGTLKASHRAFPVELQGPGLQARCAWVPREELERALERPLDEAHANLQGWRPAPRLSDASLEPPAPAQAARIALREAAALVGWDDPRVAPLVEAWDARLALHEHRLAVEVQARRAELPTGFSSPAPGLTWAPGWLAAQDPALESGPGRSWGLRLPVRLDPGQSAFGPVLGPVRDPVLIDARGRRFPVEIEMGQQDGFQGELLLLGVGMGEVERPAMPALLRAQGPQGRVFSRVDAAPAAAP